MQIEESKLNLQQYDKSLIVQVSKNGRQEYLEEALVFEHAVEVVINGRRAMKLVCTPENISELVLGRLFCDGWFDSTEEIEFLHLLDKGSTAEIKLKRNSKIKTDEAQVQKKEQDLWTDRKRLEPIRWKKEWIFTLSDYFSHDMSLYGLAHSTHCCFLMQKGEILFSCEDIKRHNAVDKVIGYALRRRLDLKKTIIYSSGRMPADIVRKVIRAGIPVFVSKGLPTMEAVEMSRDYGLTLIGRAKENQYKIFAQPE